MKIELVLAEFGASRENAGDSQLPAERTEPSLSSFLRHFPEATAVMYTDQPWESTDRCRVVKIESPPFEKRGRYGWRCNDYYQAVGLLDSKADIAFAFDSDLLIVDDRVRSILPMAERFGLCMAVNGRHLVWRDARSDSDGGSVDDPTQGMGMCNATAFWAFRTNHEQYRILLYEYCRQILLGAENRAGARGPLALWRAIWDVGIAPYTLPVQWCVTASNMGLTGEVILHVGHEKIAGYYKELIERWKGA